MMLGFPSLLITRNEKSEYGSDLSTFQMLPLPPWISNITTSYRGTYYKAVLEKSTTVCSHG